MPQVSSVPVDRTPLPADAGARKPYNGVEGYVASLRSGHGGGYVVIYVAERRKLPLATRFGVVCETHGVAAGAASESAARGLLKVPSRFCEGCATALNPFGGCGGASLGVGEGVAQHLTLDADATILQAQDLPRRPHAEHFLDEGAAKAASRYGAPPAEVPTDDGGAHFEGLAGYVRRARGVGGVGWVVIYEAAEQGIDVDGARYAVSCEVHSTVVGDRSLRGAIASMKAPEGFCDECRSLRPEANEAP